MTKFLVNITSAQALHTWEYADKTRLTQMGSSAILSMSERKKRDANRKVVGQYRTSKVATVATTMRRDVAEFTKNERTKLNARIERSNPHSQTSGPKLSPPKGRPIPDPGVYRRPNL